MMPYSFGGGLDEALFAAENGVGIANRAELVAGAGYGVVSNAGPVETNVGVEAKTGRIESVGSVMLQDRAEVHGDVITESTVGYQNESTVTVTGTITENGMSEEKRIRSGLIAAGTISLERPRRGR